MKKSNESFVKSLYFIMFMGAFCLIFIITGLSIFRTYTDYKKETANTYQEYLQDRKQMLQNEVTTVIFMLDNLLEFCYNTDASEQKDFTVFQDSLLHKLADLRFDSNNYFFGSAAGGKPLFSNGVVTKGTENIWDLEDAHGNMMIREQHKAFNNPQGVFTEYYWRKLDQEKPSKKISFTKAVPQLNWVIGAGVYLDEIAAVTKTQKHSLRMEMIHDVAANAFIFLIYSLLSFIVIKRLTGRFTRNLNHLKEYFKDVVEKYRQIDLNKLHFKEFRTLAAALNEMLHRLSSTEKKIRISENKFKLLAEIQNDLIITIDTKGRLLYISPKIKDFAGYDPEEELGNSVIKYIVSDDLRNIINQLSPQVFSVNNEKVLEVLLKPASGKPFPVEVSIAPLFENKQIIQYNAIIRDISQRKEVEKIKEKYQHELEKIIAEKTQELKEQNTRLEKLNQSLMEMNKVFTGREKRIKELRDELKKLKKRLSEYEDY